MVRVKKSHKLEPAYRKGLAIRTAESKSLLNKRLVLRALELKWMHIPVKYETDDESETDDDDFFKF